MNKLVTKNVDVKANEKNLKKFILLLIRVIIYNKNSIRAFV